MKTPTLLDMKAPNGAVFLVIVPHYWGKGNTPREAFAKCVQAGASDLGQFMLYTTASDATVDEMGQSIIHKDGTVPTLFVGGVGTWK